MPDIEAAKRNAANMAVNEHFDPKATYIGIGSGSTIVYVVEAIKALKADTTAIRFVPTGYQSRQNIVSAGLTPIAFDSLPANVLLDVAFDGADEIDEDLNCIKGGGACLYQEKLVATHAKKFICVAGKPLSTSPLPSTSNFLKITVNSNPACSPNGPPSPSKSTPLPLPLSSPRYASSALPTLKSGPAIPPKLAQLRPIKETS